MFERVIARREALAQCGHAAGGGMLVLAGPRVLACLTSIVRWRTGCCRLNPAQVARKAVVPCHLHAVRLMPEGKVPSKVPA